MTELAAQLPDGGLLLNAKGNLSGCQDKVQKKDTPNDRATNLGHVDFLKESGQSIHHTRTQDNTGNKDHMTPHKQD
jgi:hypothetical protein